MDRYCCLEKPMRTNEGVILDQGKNSFSKIAMKRLFHLVLVFFFLILGIRQAQAVPSLGVATGGTYYYSTGTTLTAYQSYFTSSLLPASNNGGYEGFGIGPSGSKLDVFTNDTGVSIWLLVNATVYNANAPSFNGKNFTEFPSYTKDPKSIPDNFNPSPFYGVDLGSVSSNGWTPISSSDFPGSYYQFSGTLDYTGQIAQGEYFFAVATTSLGSGGLGLTDFSPPTTSAVGTGNSLPETPENSTLVLMGSGMIFLLYFVRSRRRIFEATLPRH